jgi:hypothetical protein
MERERQNFSCALIRVFALVIWSRSPISNHPIASRKTGAAAMLSSFGCGWLSQSWCACVRPVARKKGKSEAFGMMCAHYNNKERKSSSSGTESELRGCWAVGSRAVGLRNAATAASAPRCQDVAGSTAAAPLRRHSFAALCATTILISIIIMARQPRAGPCLQLLPVLRRALGSARSIWRRPTRCLPVHVRCNTRPITLCGLHAQEYPRRRKICAHQLDSKFVTTKPNLPIFLARFAILIAR